MDTRSEEAWNACRWKEDVSLIWWQAAAGHRLISVNATDDSIPDPILYLSKNDASDHPAA